jgi:transcriptional regulator with XRE-family HTH domain
VATADFNETTGARLRIIRRQRGLSLQDVQRLSGGEFKAAVLGAYERGERSLSVPRLHRLAQFFQVPVARFFPAEDGSGRDAGTMPNAGVNIDLNRVERMSGTEAVIVQRFLTSIQRMRQDFSGSVLTIRRDDLRLLALLIEHSEEAFAERMEELGLAAD